MEIILVTQPGCSPCIPLKRRAEKMSNVKIIDASKDYTAISKYGIMSTPTLVISKDESFELLTIPDMIDKELDRISTYDQPVS